MASPKDGGAQAPEEDEDDYMNMTFEDPTPAAESSVRRTQRLKAESRARGVIKSKAELAEDEAAAREQALSTSLLDDPRAKKSKGLAMMAKMGFAGGGLGKKTEAGDSSGRIEPIAVSIKEDRGGVGLDNEKKRKLREAAEEHGIKTVKLDPDEYRDRVRRERKEERLENQVYAAQRTAERMDDESPLGETVDSPASPTAESAKKKRPPIVSRPLKSFPVLYRGLIRHREEKERLRRMRHDLEQSLSRLPTYEDEDEDEDDKKALGKSHTVYTTADDLDEEDKELDEFNALEAGDRLGRLLQHLRERHNYCFWCKMVYPDGEMEGCPGIPEEDHD